MNNQSIKTIRGDQPQPGVAIAIVLSRYNSMVTDRLLDGCTRTLEQSGVKPEQVTLVRVPGAFEIPVVAGQLARSGSYDVIISLGAVIRGETPHFDYICSECARGLTEISLATGIPVIFGVLTVENMQQALDRSGEEESNKGAEAATTALEMAALVSAIRKET